MSTLLETAKSVKSKQNIEVSDEVVELALAWMKGQITTTQASMATTGLRRKSGNALYRFAVAFRKAYQDGRLVIK